MGIIDGPHSMDLCGNCLLEDDPLFNTACPERFRTYLPTIFNPADGEFGMMYDSDNLGELVSFEIYDRWGSLLFEIENTLLVDVTQWWDGRMENELMDTGVYSYRYHIAYPGFEDEISAGTILLIR